MQAIDFMAVGAHADDVELGCGGTLLRLASLGRKGVIVDLTDASMGTRGTPEIRMREAAAAAKALKIGAAARINLGLPDGRLADSWEAQKLLVGLIRKHRPKVILTHHWSEEHPDHEAAAALVKHAAFKAGLAKLDCPGAPFRPGRIFHFVEGRLHEPSFCVDISAHWQGKLKAILCYKSQFHHAGAAGFKGRTDLSTPAFLENLEARSRFWGIRIKRRHAEAFVCAELPEIDDITALGGERFS